MENFVNGHLENHFATIQMNTITPSTTTMKTTISASNLNLSQLLLFYFLMELILFSQDDHILESLSSRIKIRAQSRTSLLPHLMDQRPQQSWQRLKLDKLLQALKSSAIHLNGTMIQILNVLME